MKKQAVAKALFISLLGWASLMNSAQATGLIEAYSLAMRNDPTFMAAIKEKEAGEEFKNIGRAALLPRVNASYQNTPHNWQRRESQQTNFFGQTSEVIAHQRYESSSASVTLTQPLFDYEAWSRYQMGIAQSLMADERYRSKLLDLAVRVTNTYLDLTSAQDRLLLAQAQIAAYEKQLKFNQQMLTGGEGTVTDISETEAAYNMAKANAIEAENAVGAARRALEALTGRPLEQTGGAQTLRRDRFQLINLTPSRYQDWEAMALKNNPVIAETNLGVKATKHNVERSRAGFMPTVNLYASHSLSNSDTNTTINEKYRTDSIGVQVSMPLFSGGETLAATRQASAKYGQAMYERDAQVISTLNELRKEFELIQSSQAKISAYQYAVQNAQTRVEATRHSVMAGQRVNVDIINALQQLYQARSELSDAKYAYIKAYIGLMNNAGILSDRDIVKAASYFTPVKNKITDNY